MKKFRFALDPAVQFWERRVEQEELKLSRLLARQSALEAGVERLRAQRQSVEEASTRCVEVQAVELFSFQEWRESVRRELAGLAVQIQQGQQDIVAQRLALREAARSLKTLERLKEKRLGEWKAQADAEQEQLAAELYLANQRFR